LYLLQFIFINSISCDASQSKNVLMIFSFFWVAMSHLVGLSQKHYETPRPPPQVEIIFFTLFYTYTILYDRIKSYKCIYLVLHIHCFTQHKIDLQGFTFTLHGL